MQLSEFCIFNSNCKEFLKNIVFNTTMVYIFQYFFQGNAYGYAYGSSRRSQGGYYRGREEAQAEDTRLKNLIRDTREAMNNTRQFWTKLPYDLCR